MSSNFLSLKPLKTEFIVIGLPEQLGKLNHPTIHLPNDVILPPIDSARNLGVIFDSNPTLSDHISAVSKSCLYHIRDLRRIRCCFVRPKCTKLTYTCTRNSNNFSVGYTPRRFGRRNNPSHTLPRLAYGPIRGHFAPPAPWTQMPTSPGPPKFPDRSPPLSSGLATEF